MVTVSEYNGNPEASEFYILAKELSEHAIKLLDIARETKYHDSIEANQSYPEIVSAISRVKKIQGYVDETIKGVAKYERTIKPPRIYDRPARSSQGRKNTTRVAFSLDALMDSD